MGSVGVVVAAHAPLASALCATASDILAGDPAASPRWVEIEPGAGADATLRQVSAAIHDADEGAGVLLLADLFGGSAANIALACLGEHTVEVVTGANLPMLLEALTHCSTAGDPAALAGRVARAAQDSVIVAGTLLMPQAHGSPPREANP